MALKQRSKSLQNIYGTESHRAIYSEIANVKRRIKLVEGERRANYESNEEELKNNEIKIEELRKQISAKKKEVEIARKSSGDFYSVVAANLPEGDRKIANVFRGKTFEESKEILESYIGDSTNRLNLVKYKKREMKAQLKQLLQEEKQLEGVLFGGNKNLQPMLKELRETENNGALMEMRIIEVENIQAKYKTMLETLKLENYTKENLIRTMEQTILNQQKEQQKLEEALTDALKARKAARIKLVEVEETTMKEFSEREEKLMEARQELQQTRERMEEIGNKLSYPKFHMSHRDSSLVDGLYYFGSVMGQEEVKTEHVVERVYEKLAEMTGESDPVAIVKRFEEQRNHAEELDHIEADLKSKARKEKLRKQFLEDKLTQLQYSGGIKREILDTQITELNDTIAQTKDKQVEIEKRTQELKKVLEEAMKKLNRLCTRNQIPVPLDVGSKETGIGECVNTTLKTLFEKVETILLEDAKNTENIFIFPSSPPFLSPESDSILPTFSYGSSAELNFLDTATSGLLGVRSRRTSISSTRGMDKGTLLPCSRPGSRIQSSADRDRDIASVSGVTMLSKRSESSEDEEAATRNSIKLRSQQMVEAKTRKGRYKASSTTPVSSRHPSRAGIQ